MPRPKYIQSKIAGWNWLYLCNHKALDPTFLICLYLA
jgi:hypothetical protein